MFYFCSISLYLFPINSHFDQTNIITFSSALIISHFNSLSFILIVSLLPPSSMQSSNNTMQISITITQRRGITVLQPKTILSERRSPLPQTYQSPTSKNTANHMLTKSDYKGDTGKGPKTT
ncbi:hypothetical protein V8G54_026426 [Vigna mungo]|uniref:Uncharacterized protein n=1 Tax=Vigna mungo TaxID=3915 RepID=A0AAQ3N0A8_VIGMU